MNQNNSHLIAGFFRYHREKLNYSLRGLVGDGKVVDLSSLSAFENGKKCLDNTQLNWLFEKIGYKFDEVLKSYSFDKEYCEILELLLLGQSKKAEELYLKCISNLVFDSLGAMKFSVLKYALSAIYDKYIEIDRTCLTYEVLLDTNQIALLRIASSIIKFKSGFFDESIEFLKEAQNISFDPKIRAWIIFQFGRIYGSYGNYAEATVALLDAKQRYGEFLSIIRMIQVNLDLGAVYSLTNSIGKAEEAYLEAYDRCLLLKDSTYLLTKCFNNLCWLYFKINQYNKVNDLLINKPENLEESRNTNFVLAWSYYKLNNKDEAIRLCQEGMEKYSKYTYVCMVYEYIEKACKGIKTGQDALLRKIIETEDYDNTAEIKELFTYEIIDIYERRKNYEKAFKYAKKLLNR